MNGCAKGLSGCACPDIPDHPGALVLGGAGLESSDIGLLKFPETVYGSLGRLDKMGWNPTLGGIPVGLEGGAPSVTAVWLFVPASPLNSLRNLSMFFSILSDKSSSRPGNGPA